MQLTEDLYYVGDWPPYTEPYKPWTWNPHVPYTPPPPPPTITTNVTVDHTWMLVNAINRLADVVEALLARLEAKDAEG